MSSLLDPEFIRQLARLKVVVRRKLAGSSAGSRQSLRRGASVEFADHRAYVPGDDLRRIDWNAYARLGELVLRLYVAEEDVTVHLLVDTSASLGIGNPTKLEVAQRLAAALGYLGLSGSERVAVVPFRAGMERPFPPSRGSKRIGPLLRFLDALEPDGETNLARTVDTFLARRPRPGLVVILSDLMDPQGYQRPIDRLLAEKHEPAIFHVLDKSELKPERGDYVLVDSEHGSRVDISIDARALAAYQKRLDSFLREAESYAKARGIAYTLVGGDVPMEDALLSYLRAG